MGKDDAKEELKILLPEKKFIVKRDDKSIPIVVHPFPLETLLPKLAAMMERRDAKAPIDWRKLNLQTFLIDSLDGCCDLSKKEIGNLTAGEKLGILKVAVFELDPELPKNLVELANQVLSMTRGINT